MPLLAPAIILLAGAPDAPWMVLGVIGGSRLSWLADGSTTVVVEVDDALRFASVDEIDEVEAARRAGQPH